MALSRPSSQRVITCQISQGIELTANLLRIIRDSVVIELSHPYRILQLPEVLSDFRIMIRRAPAPQRHRAGRRGDARRPRRRQGQGQRGQLGPRNPSRQ